MQDTTIAVDLAKSVFEIAVSSKPGQVAQRRRLSRGQFERFLAGEVPATVVMEACGTAHHWGRQAERSGHRVVLLSPHAVRPYVLRNKTDGADAKALLEALRNRDLRPVPVKQIDQHVIAGLHRMRSAWLATRTARINTVRGLLREIGFVIPLGARRVVPELEARRSVPAHAADPRRPVRARPREALESRARWTTYLGARAREGPGAQQGGGRPGQQARAHRLGRG
jgi:transposase